MARMQEQLACIIIISMVGISIRSIRSFRGIRGIRSIRSIRTRSSTSIGSITSVVSNRQLISCSVYSCVCLLLLLSLLL